MRKIIFIAVIIISNLTAMAQNSFRVTKDSVDGGIIFNGPVTMENLERERTFGWMKKGEDSYTPNEKSMTVLKFYLRQYTMVVFLGTWCDDSHNLIPKLQKVLLASGYPSAAKLTMFGVDRAKATYGYEHKRYEIVNVPTIILYKDDAEVGRITETVKTTVEGDLVALIEEDMAGGKQPH